MGCILSTPVELIRVQRSGSAAFRCAVAEMQGWRVGHEDAHEMHCGDASGIFFVLDGHGGDGAAIYGAPELVKEFREEVGKGGTLPSDERLEQGFAGVDSRFRSWVKLNPEKDSGSTVVGAMIARQGDGTYSLKLLNCGDSRGVVVRGPAEDEEGVSPVPLRIPTHLEGLAGNEEAIAKGDAPPSLSFPMVAESVDHKPNHPTEKARIVAAGGTVSQEDPPRLDGNLAVSRGLGDFEYKQDAGRPVPEQKVSCVPDVYELSGLRPGSICVLACDGIWDVMTGSYVGNFVRDALRANAKADLGEIAAELVRSTLDKNSRDNVTVMIVQFTDGADWNGEADEIKGYEKLSKESDFDEEVRKQYLAFLRRCGFPAAPCPCAECKKWIVDMHQCPCKQVYYCGRQCQKKGWKTHKTECPAANPGSSSSSPAKGAKGKK